MRSLTRLPAVLAAALLSLPTGCASAKLLRLENDLLKGQLDELRVELATCEQDAPPPDFATSVTLDVVREYLTRAGYPPTAQPSDHVLTLPIQGESGTFQLSARFFAREKVLFMVVTDYIEIEQATSSAAMVLLLTQLAALNYEMLLGKFQLNPATGAISLSVELNLEDGLGYRTFTAVLSHLLRTADSKHPELLRAAQGRGM